MKTLEIRRHTDKTGEHASQAGLDAAKNIQLRSKVTDVFCGSDFGRTAETMVAVIAYHGIKAERVHASDSRLGSKELFDQLVAAGFVEARKETGDNLAAAKKCLGAEYTKVRETICDAVFNILRDLPEGAHGLAFSHSPLIEMVVDKWGTFCGETRELASCEGFLFRLKGDVLEVFYA